MLISICGTPGTGKTTVSSMLSSWGIRVISLRDLIEELDIDGEWDSASGSLLIDPEVLTDSLEVWDTDERREDEDTYLEGHLSYLAPSDITLFLRANPDVISERLRSRGYGEEKIRENAESEGLSSLLVDAMDMEDPGVMDRLSSGSIIRGGRLVLERDVTDLDPDITARWILDMVDACRGKELNRLLHYRPGNVDWMEVMYGWY